MANKAPASSVKALVEVVKALGTMADDVVFIGGSVVGFLITDKAAPEVRPTEDVDFVVSALSYGDYRNVDERLRALGFRNDPNRNICSYKLGDLKVDVLPSDPTTLTMCGVWMKEALKQFTKFELGTGCEIKIVDAPYFLALKLEAFADRSNNDFYCHKDAEDTIRLIDGRLSLVEEVKASPEPLRRFIRERIEAQKDDWKNCVPAHIGDGQGDKMRVPIVCGRIEKLSQEGSKSNLEEAEKHWPWLMKTSAGFKKEVESLEINNDAIKNLFNTLEQHKVTWEKFSFPVPKKDLRIQTSFLWNTALSLIPADSQKALIQALKSSKWWSSLSASAMGVVQIEVIITKTEFGNEIVESCWIYLDRDRVGESISIAPLFAEVLSKAGITNLDIKRIITNWPLAHF